MVLFGSAVVLRWKDIAVSYMVGRGRGQAHVLGVERGGGCVLWWTAGAV